MDNLANFLLEIQNGRLNIGPLSEHSLAITFEPNGVEMQTWCLFHSFRAWGTHWNTYFYDWVCLDL